MTIKKQTFVLYLEYTQEPDWQKLLTAVEQHILYTNAHISKVEIDEDFDDICRDMICDDCDERRGEPMRNEGYD